MQKVNVADLAESVRVSPKGKFGRASRMISVALGGDEDATDLLKRHPFDVTLCRIVPGKSLCPYHSHSAQWEFYHVVSGRGSVRHADGATAIGSGDAFIFKPGEPHQMTNDGTEDLVFYIVADNPLGESCHYPDSGKWAVSSPEGRVIRSEALDYFDGEE